MTRTLKNISAAATLPANKIESTRTKYRQIRSNQFAKGYGRMNLKSTGKELASNQIISPHKEYIYVNQVNS